MGQRKRVWINKAVNERRRNSVTVHSIATKPHALRWRLNSASSACSFARSRRAARSSIIRHSSSLISSSSRTRSTWRAKRATFPDPPAARSTRDREFPNLLFGHDEMISNSWGGRHNRPTEPHRLPSRSCKAAKAAPHVAREGEAWCPGRHPRRPPSS